MLGFSLGEVSEGLVDGCFGAESRLPPSPLCFFLGGAVWDSADGFLAGSSCGRVQEGYMNLSSFVSPIISSKSRPSASRTWSNVEWR